MDERHSVELQAEIHAGRDIIWPLLSTSDGLGRWLGATEIPRSVGGPVRLTIASAAAHGVLLALDPPQHVSFTFDWDEASVGGVTVVALDAIDHGATTHLTLRHVGLPAGRERDRHAALWREQFGRLVRVAEETARKAVPASR